MFCVGTKAFDFTSDIPIFFCMYVNRKEEEDAETEQQLQSYQFTQGYITLHRLQVHHYNLYSQSILCQHSIYIHTYLFTTPSIKMIFNINIRYTFLGWYNI